MNQAEKRAFYKELIALAIPLGLQNLLIALIGATDALMLGRLSQEAVAAVSLANQISFVMNLFIGAVVGGGGALIAQYWGKGDGRMVKNLFCTILKYTIVISVVFFLLAFLIPEKLMGIFTPEQELIQIGAEYLKIVSFSYIFNGATQCYYLMMKISGKVAKSVVISIVTVVTDVVVDFFLIYGIAGVPKLGANGSAYSTIAVEVIALVWCVADSYSKEGIHPDMEGLKWFSPTHIKDFMKIAIPTLASSLAWGLSISMHSLIMGHLGTDATAAASITSVTQELVVCICKGVATGTGIMIGKLLGQNLLEKAKEYGKEFWKVSIWVGVINIALLCIVGPIVTIFFVLTETARQYLIYMLLFSGLYLFAYSFNTVMTCGVFPAGGDAKYDAVSVGLATWCFAIPLALVGTFLLKLPVMVVYVLMCADEIVKLPWLLPHYRKYLWLKNLTHEE